MGQLAGEEIKSWRAVHTGRWTLTQVCSSCGAHLAGFDYRRRVYRETHKRGTREYTILVAVHECDSVGCALA